MRTHIIAAALALTIAPAIAAQSPSLPTAISKGSKLIAGSAQLVRSSSEGGDATTISVSPNILFFVADRVALGGEASLSHTTSDGFSSTSWTLGPAARYFFATSSARTLPFLGGSVELGRATSGGSDFEAQLFNVEGVLGLIRLLNDHVGVSAEAFVANRRTEVTSPPLPDTEVTFTTMGLRFGVAAFIR